MPLLFSGGPDQTAAPVRPQDQTRVRELCFSDTDAARVLFGELNSHLHAVEQGAGVEIAVRGCDLAIRGQDHAVDLAASLLEQLYALARRGLPIHGRDVDLGLRILAASPEAGIEEIFLDKVYVTARKRTIAPRTLNQRLYIEAMREHDLVFGIGPAGTGKTYLAVAVAAAALRAGEVDRIVLTRPAVEAGERLGFLPGDMARKVDPYLRPLYDALRDMLGLRRRDEYIERGIIEVAPLAFMRGRTLSRAFIILDEAQNTTREQMKMLLTRIGEGSRAVVTGDPSQVDLPRGQVPGLADARRILARVPGVAFCHFTEADVLRHGLVRRIVQAYEADGQGGEPDGRDGDGGRARKARRTP